jgi:hypothetical protein
VRHGLGSKIEPPTRVELAPVEEAKPCSRELLNASSSTGSSVCMRPSDGRAGVSPA